MNPQITVARGEDADAIVSLIRAGFEPHLVELFIYGCMGMASYVRAQIEAMARGGDTYFLVAGDPVVGCIEVRSLRDQLFLNYVAVAPEARRARIAQRLLRETIRVSAMPSHRTMTLDVLEHNRAAIQWYTSLGFRDVASTEWWTLDLVGNDARPAHVVGLPQARVTHETFGFSRVTIASAPARDVGLMGSKWFRITDPEALTDRELLAALGRLDVHHERRLLALLPAGRLPTSLSAHATRVTATRRMTLELDVLVAALEERLR